MNLAATLEIYCVQTGGEPVRSTLPEDGTNHPETPFSKEQQRKREQILAKKKRLKADSAGTQVSGPGYSVVIHPAGAGRVLHKGIKDYATAKRAAEATRYGKVVPNRGDTWQDRPMQRDLGKRKISDVERRSMHDPDFDWTTVR